MLSECLQFFLIWLSVNKIHGFSFRSSTNVRGVPILRSVPYDPAVLEYNGGDTPTWVQDLTARIERLVSRHGLKRARPYIEKAVENAELKHSVLLNVKVEGNGKYVDMLILQGESKVLYQLNPKSLLRAYPEDNKEEYKDGLKVVREFQPVWLSELKEYVTKVISQYGRKDLDIHLRPVIASIQEKHNVTITDIDVDKFGKLISGKVMITAIFGKPKEVQLQFVST